MSGKAKKHRQTAKKNVRQEKAGKQRKGEVQMAEKAAGEAAFWPENCVRSAKRLVVSSRFCDEEGQPMEWQVEPLTAKDLLALYREGGGRNVGVRLLALAVSEPDLRSAQLQDRWGVMGAEQLLLAMLSPGEYQRLEEAFKEVNL